MCYQVTYFQCMKFFLYQQICNFVKLHGITFWIYCGYFFKLNPVDGLLLLVTLLNHYAYMFTTCLIVFYHFVTSLPDLNYSLQNMHKKQSNDPFGRFFEKPMIIYFLINICFKIFKPIFQNKYLVQFGQFRIWRIPGCLVNCIFFSLLMRLPFFIFVWSFVLFELPISSFFHTDSESTLVFIFVLYIYTLLYL